MKQIEVLVPTCARCIVLLCLRVKCDMIVVKEAKDAKETMQMESFSIYHGVGMAIVLVLQQGTQKPACVPQISFTPHRHASHTLGITHTLKSSAVCKQCGC